jgi:ferrochelatase
MSDSSRVGVLLLQLGTPDEPTPAALRRYLAEFLSDRRVIDLPRARWWPILHGIVLRTRPRQSARLYQKVWTPDGSPLATTTRAQAEGLRQRLAARGADVPVVVGMRYGEPSIARAIAGLARDGVDRILLFSLFPQYSSATTGSSLQRVLEHISALRVVPSVRVVPPYFADAGYIGALASVARETLASVAEPIDRVLFSFHGLPRRYVVEGDPYQDHCEETGRLLAKALDLPSDQAMVVFQSRFGREEWLQPYADRTFEALGRAGKRIAVMCPGFVADCLETLEEIGMRGDEQFHAAGGRSFRVIPCLNTHASWIDAMTVIAERELSGWIPAPGRRGSIERSDTLEAMRTTA